MNYRKNNLIIFLYCFLLIAVFLNRFNEIFRFLIYSILIFPVFVSSYEKIGLKNFRIGLLLGCISSLIFVPFILNKFLIKDLLKLPYVFIEELFFRGYLMDEMQKKDFHITNLIVSFLFAIPHLVKDFSLLSFLTFFPSLIFGYLYYYSGSLLSPTIFHWSSNLFFQYNTELFHIVIDI